MHTVPERANKIQQAIVEKNFKIFAELTMKDSNEMHATCLDTYPPCVYMNDISHSIVNLIHSYNDAVNDVKVQKVLNFFIITYLYSKDSNTIGLFFFIYKKKTF